MVAQFAFLIVKTDLHLQSTGMDMSPQWQHKQERWEHAYQFGIQLIPALELSDGIVTKGAVPSLLEVLSVLTAETTVLKPAALGITCTLVKTTKPLILP